MPDMRNLPSLRNAPAESEVVAVIDLVGEVMPSAWAMTRRPHQDQIAAADVSHWAIYGPPPCLHGNCGPARVSFHGNLFEFDPDGDGVFVMAVSEGPAEPILDLVAFKLVDPCRWWLRLGQGVVLGLHNARLALFEEAPVLVHGTPLDWLRADCQGVVVLDWKADILSRLDGFGVLAADGATGKRLERAFQRHIHVPEIRVLGEHRAAA